jgi:transglutaminase-like putative cysteine protease
MEERKHSMLFTINHTTEYCFTRPVFFEPHQLRFCPRSDGSQRLIRFDLHIEPTPAGVTQALDVEGNVLTMAWFDDVHERMVLRATSEVETLRENPFDFLLTPTNQRLPIAYQPWEAAQLGPALRRTAPIHVDPARELAEQLREASRGEVVPFLARLTETICNRFKVIHREQGGPWAPATTIEQRQGACRDLAVLWIDICRSVGLAARFVSGYQEGDAEQDKRHLHAWAEVYLPGAGWRGFDPTHGLAVADRHVTIAAATDPPHAAPVSATYRGNNIQAELHAEVLIECESAVAVAAC